MQFVGREWTSVQQRSQGQGAGAETHPYQTARTSLRVPGQCIQPTCPPTEFPRKSDKVLSGGPSDLHSSSFHGAVLWARKGFQCSLLDDEFQIYSCSTTLRLHTHHRPLRLFAAFFSACICSTAFFISFFLFLRSLFSRAASCFASWIFFSTRR